MKTYFYATAMVVACGLSAYAAETINSTGNSDTLAANKLVPLENDYVHRFGAGIILGEPTGGSLKYFLNDKLAVDGAVGWSTHDHSNLYLQGDLLWHNFDVFPVPQGRLPLYIGAGGFVRFRDDHRDNQVGIRVPVGVSYMFENAPVDIFAEIAPAIDVAPEARGELTGGVGVRFWF